MDTADEVIEAEETHEEDAAGIEEAARLTALRAEIASLDVGELAKTDKEKLVYRYMRRRASIVAEQACIAAGVEKMLSERDAELRRLDFLFGKEVQAIVAEMLKGETRKSIKTPWGVLGFKTKKELLQVENEAEVIDAWKAMLLPGDVVKMVEKEPTYKVVKAELDVLYASTKKLPPGCTLRPESEEFYVKEEQP